MLLRKTHLKMAQYQRDLAEARVAQQKMRKVSKELQKAAIIGRSKVPSTEPGYVFIEVGDLVMWLVKRNHGLEQTVADAVASVARDQFLQIAGVEYA